MACLKQQDWAKALRNARAAIELAADRQNTPIKDSSQHRQAKSLLKLSASASAMRRTRDADSREEDVGADRAKRFLSAASRSPADIRASASTSALLRSSSKNATAGSATNVMKKPGESMEKPTQQTFLTLSRRYKLGHEQLVPSFESVLKHLHEQGWNETKWNENIAAIRLAVFYWVCKEKNQGLRDLKIIAEETTVSHKIASNVLKSMETIRPRLLQLLAQARPPQLDLEEMSPRSEGKEKEKQFSPPAAHDDESDEEASHHRRAKRQRRELDGSQSGSPRAASSTLRSPGRLAVDEDQMDVDELPASTAVSPSTPSKRPLRSHVSTAASPSASLASQHTSLPLQGDTLPLPTKSKTPRKAAPPRTVSSPRKQPAAFRNARTTAPRYRPVFPDRMLYTGDYESEDGMEVEAEDEALDAWMAKTHAMLAVTAA